MAVSQDPPSHELGHLVGELRNADTIESAEFGLTGITVKFTVDLGAYNHLSSEVVSILGRYDVEVYTIDQQAGEYYAVP